MTCIHRFWKIYSQQEKICKLHKIFSDAQKDKNTIQPIFHFVLFLLLLETLS